MKNQPGRMETMHTRLPLLRERSFKTEPALFSIIHCDTHNFIFNVLNELTFSKHILPNREKRLKYKFYVKDFVLKCSLDFTFILY